MPTVALRTRRPDLVEIMDDPECDPARLDRTYAHFVTLNRLIAGWGKVYRRWIRPRLREGGSTLLDIGCGGGAVAHLLRVRALRDGFDLRVTGIDPDERAIRYARRFTDVEAVRCDSATMAATGRRFDVVLSNHLLHHLDDRQRAGLLRDSETLARHVALHNDIRRDDLGYAAFSLLGFAFPRSFIRDDGLTSVRRSYTQAELEAVLPDPWRCHPLTPCRLLAVHERPD